MNSPARVRSAPGLVWKPKANGTYEARWQARTDIKGRGYPVKSVKLWTGTGDPLREEWDLIADTCHELQQDMLIWAHGGLIEPVVFRGTLRTLMDCYRRDTDSSYKKLRYASKMHYDDLMRIIRNEVDETHENYNQPPMIAEDGATIVMVPGQKGDKPLSEIKARTFLRWYEGWAASGKTAIGHSKIGMLRTVFGFGATILEDPDCLRLKGVLSGMRFAMPKARTERLTAAQAIAIRAKAHEMGRPSIALAQAFQFELMLRQKDCIGEWVPLSEPGVSDLVHEQLKWMRGIRWEEIDENLVLRHITSKKQKEIVVNLRNAPMVMEELDLLGAIPARGPLVISEWDNLPWTAPEFRRWWRKIADLCGVPKKVKNMDSRAGAITEASESGADLEFIRHAATHSNISMTQRYSRGAEEKIAAVQIMRIEHRNKPKT